MYPQFCEFGKFVDDTLRKLGGKCVLPVACGDDQLDQENAFKTWSIDAFNVSFDKE